jgi:predicted transcriptional regulator
LKKGEWTFLTNHGRVLVYIAKRPRSTTQEIAREAGITLRAVGTRRDDVIGTQSIPKSRCVIRWNGTMRWVTFFKHWDTRRKK